MALFNRRSKTDVPEEIQEYYQTEKRERAGIAWLLAFGTLIVTIVLAAAIFFAGRWAYRKIAGNNDTPTTTQVAQNDDQSQEGSSSDSSDEQTEEEKKAEAEKKAEEARRAEEERQADEERERQNEQENQSESEEERERSGSQSTEQSADGGDVGDQQIAATGDTIPDTGPGDTLAIFLAVSALGYVAHRMYTSKATK